MHSFCKTFFKTSFCLERTKNEYFIWIKKCPGFYYFACITSCSCVASENHQALVKFLTEKGLIPGLFEGKVWLGDLNINEYKFQFIVYCLCLTFDIYIHKEKIDFILISIMNYII